MIAGPLLGIAGLGLLLYSQNVIRSYSCFAGCSLPFGAANLGVFALMSYFGLGLVAVGVGVFFVSASIYVLHRRISNIGTSVRN
jgi:hypothetical protein